MQQGKTDTLRRVKPQLARGSDFPAMGSGVPLCPEPLCHLSGDRQRGEEQPSWSTWPSPPFSSWVSSHWVESQKPEPAQSWTDCGEHLPACLAPIPAWLPGTCCQLSCSWCQALALLLCMQVTLWGHRTAELISALNLPLKFIFSKLFLKNPLHSCSTSIFSSCNFFLWQEAVSASLFVCSRAVYKRQEPDEHLGQRKSLWRWVLPNRNLERRWGRVVHHLRHPCSTPVQVRAGISGAQLEQAPVRFGERGLTLNYPASLITNSCNGCAGVSSFPLLMTRGFKAKCFLKIRLVLC